MTSSQINSRYHTHDIERFCQGDILRDITLVEWASKKAETIEIQTRELPYTVILTQDCDLEQDINNRVNKDSQVKDKYLQSVLLCPAYLAEQLRSGEHMKKINIIMQRHSSDPYRIITGNNNCRYHYLPSFDEFQIPDLILDFKQYFTIPRDVLYNEFKDTYLASISELFRENLSQRFTQYLSRVAEPELKIETGT